MFFWAVGLAVLAILLFGTTSMIQSIVAFKVANRKREDLRLRRDAEARRRAQSVTNIELQFTALKAELEARRAARK